MARRHVGTFKLAPRDEELASVKELLDDPIIGKYEEVVPVSAQTIEGRRRQARTRTQELAKMLQEEKTKLAALEHFHATDTKD